VNLNLGLIGKAGVAILWIVVAVVVLSDRNNISPPAATGTTTSVSTNANPTSTSKANNQVTNRQQSQPTALRPLKAALAKRVEGFISAYYLIKPSDTQESRRQRVAPFVAAKVLPLLDLGLSSGTEADNARINRKLTLHGRASLSQLEVAQSADDQKQWIVTVPVIITIKRSNGQTINRYSRGLTSKWQLTNDKWELVNFNSAGGDAE
jgi:hypothetical protein